MSITLDIDNSKRRVDYSPFLMDGKATLLALL